MGVHCVGSVPPFALMKTIVWKVIRWAFVCFIRLCGCTPSVCACIFYAADVHSLFSTIRCW